MYYRVHPFGFPGLWWLVGLICIVVLVVGVGWLVATALRGGHRTPPQPWQPPYTGAPPAFPPQAGTTPPAPMRPTPHDILRERLARGEISVEEYQRTVAVLGPDPYAPQPPQPPQG